MQKYNKFSCETIRQHNSRTHRMYRLGGKLVEVAAAFVAPDDYAVDANELASDPSLSTTARLRA